MVDMREEVGDVVRSERLRRGWSMREAAQVGGCSHTYWDSIERGEARKPVLVRNVVAKAFGWPDDWIENPPPPPAVIERDDQVLAEFRQWGETTMTTLREMQQQIVELQQAVVRLASSDQSPPSARRRQS